MKISKDLLDFLQHTLGELVVALPFMAAVGVAAYAILTLKG